MKIVYMGIWKNDRRPGIELASEFDVTSFGRFTQRTIQGLIPVFVEPVALAIKPYQRHQIEHEPYTVHGYGHAEGFCGIIVSDQEYPPLVAQQILSKLVDDFATKYPRTAFANATKDTTLSLPELKEAIIKYQDPQNADSIMKIQKELDETKFILHKTIESVLQRGEKLDDLVAKSDGLSAQSKMFYTQECLCSRRNMLD